MVASNEIQDFLERLCVLFNQAGPNLGIYQFGSSINAHKFTDRLDIDLLLLSTCNRYDDFPGKLKYLKQNMLRGDYCEGFELSDHNFVSKITEELARQDYADAYIIPKFNFGPINIAGSEDRIPAIYLHIKGPLTPDQLRLFGAEFPFHTLSIIKDCRKLYGNFELNGIAESIIPSKKLFEEFADALWLRAAKAQSSYEVKKCVKKLLQNYAILVNEDLEEHFDVELILKRRFDIETGQLTIADLKLIFLKLRQTMMYRLESLSVENVVANLPR